MTDRVLGSLRTDRVLSHLRAALGRDGPEGARSDAALRLRLRLEPAGGEGAKMMPPTYVGETGPIYIHERRPIEGELRECVLLDSVASQANRMEEALNQRILAGEDPVPTILVDQGEFGCNSALEFSHRCFDAWVEDALLDGAAFGQSESYRQLASVVSRHTATPLMERFPVGLILGCWASRRKNPQGTTRIARALTSEILAVDAEPGEAPSSKIDRHHVSAAIRVYESADAGQRLTLDPEQAVKNVKGEPTPFAGGKPSEAGYGNVTPKRAEVGGISMGYALQLAVLSLPALRECRFPHDGASATERDVAGRVMLAALAIRMLALQVEHGYDLRSGCLLVPREEPTLELVGRLGATVTAWPIDQIDAHGLLATAIDAGREQGLDWSGQRIELVASEAQLELLRQSLARVTTETA
jgi:CRISPR-associated protein Csb1